MSNVEVLDKMRSARNFPGRRGLPRACLTVLFALVCNMASAVLPVPDSVWTRYGSQFIKSGSVSALATDGTYIYAGGCFTNAGGTAVSNVAKWTGSSWVAMGTGLNGTVKTFTINGSYLYAGGAFTNTGTYPATNIAVWDGTKWQGFGGGINGPVNALTWDNSKTYLYAGGGFTLAGGVAATNIAKWTGAAWTSLDSGLNGAVRVFYPDTTGNIYVGGDFTYAGALAVSNIAKWTGGSWSTVGSGMNGGVHSFAFDSSTSYLYAGGTFTTAGGVNATNIAKWTGAAWTAVGTGINGNVDSLVFDTLNNLYAGGAFVSAGSTVVSNVAKLVGSAWQAVGGTSPNGEVRSIFFDSSGYLYAGGSFNSAGASGTTNIAKLVGSAWTAMGSGLTQAVPGKITSVVLDGLGDIYAGGDFNIVGTTNANNVAKWNGSAWVPLGNGLNGPVNAIVPGSNSFGNYIFAGGNFTFAGNTNAADIAAWDGTTWTPLSSGLGGGNYSGPVVQTMVSGSSSGVPLYVGGSFTTAGGVTVANIASWNGSSWSSLSTGISGGALPGTQVLALCLDKAGHLYAGGNFTQAGAASVVNIAAWNFNNSTWSAVGSGLAGVVDVLTSDFSGDIFAGGSLSAYNNLAKWNGASWSGPAAFTGGPVQSLIFDNTTNLYVGGNFTLAGGVAANNIARMALGNTCYALGSGANSNVTSLAVDTYGNLFLGGNFSSVGGAACYGAAEAQLVPVISVYDGPTLLTSGSTLNFGNFDEGSSSSNIVLTITNSGYENLTVTYPILLDGDAATNYALTTNKVAYLIPSGSNTSFTVTFFPVTPGVRDATVHITNNTVAGPYKVSLTASANVPVATLLTKPKLVSNLSTFQFTFTNTPGTFYQVYATTNVTIPLSNWTILGGVTEVTSGHFQFLDTNASNYSQRFYLLQAP